MTALLMALAVACQTADNLPTGVIPEGIPKDLPNRSAYVAYGTNAKKFISDVFDAESSEQYGDDRIPAGGKPWLVMIGPEKDTGQIASQIPEDVRPLIEIREYTPDDKRLERTFKQYYQGGTHALLLKPDGEVYWHGLASIAEILRQLNRLLKREPDPPWPIVPIPIPPFSLPDLGGTPVFWSAILGFLVGLFGRAIVVAALRSIKKQLRELIREVNSIADPEEQAATQKKKTNA